MFRTTYKIEGVKGDKKTVREIYATTLRKKMVAGIPTIGLGIRKEEREFGKPAVVEDADTIPSKEFLDKYLIVGSRLSRLKDQMLPYQTKEKKLSS